MKLTLIYAFVGIALTLFACGKGAQTTTNPSAANTTEPPSATAMVSEVLSPADFATKLTASPDAQLLDVRTAPELGGGYLPGMKNIDFRAGNFAEQAKTLDPNKPVFVYCAAGSRSAGAAKVLQDLGFKEVYDMAGGFTQWKAQGMDFVKK